MNEKSAGRLAQAASPYLRSAVHQQVDWYEWGDEAFAQARAEDKPILLDIGAVWCHWCHVIDRESYENPQLAAVINQLFIPVKVDRDERPDVDARYQAAISTLSGQGGWPLTGFLLPDGRPFYGGTYFPPEDGMGRPGFRRVLEAVAAAFRDKRADVEEAAGRLAEAVANAETFAGGHGRFDSSVVLDQAESIVGLFDPTNGGFGRSPKFPHSAAIDLLLEIYQSSDNQRMLQVAAFTLEKMGSGGVYDQVAGGFHRYSVDERWCVPHFEKMSYDNSELLKNFLHAYQVTRDLFFHEIAEGIIDWTNAVLSDQEHGGFYASQDADQTLDDDGDYFTWTQAEARAVLTPEESRIVEMLYDVEPHGEMHHNPAKNVLWRARSIAEVTRTIGGGLEMSEVRRTLASAKAKLLAARLARPTPYVDTTLYVAWNAMYASAYLEAATVLGGSKGVACRAFALKTLDRMLSEAWSDARGFAHRVGGARLEGSLDDQIFAGIALVDAYEATLDPKYFDAARRATDFALAEYFDSEKGGFFDRASGAPPMGGLEVRRKPLQDSPTPGANSMAAILLNRLYGYSGDARYRDAAEKTLEAFASIAPRFGIHAASYGLAALLHARGPYEVVVTGRSDDPQAAALEAAAYSVYRFGKGVLRVTPERMASQKALAPALAETLPHLRADVAQALVCVGTSCRPPVSEPAALVALLTQKPIMLSAD
ncbi:MAG TPA: thioredoxin domain-containing protein [Candidatus Acidoferrales bacterium]|nr:thioredoxin domain-containing protein [Candidatus Acidoferrales bacterium]